MNLVHALYPYVLAAVNTAIGWLSFTVLDIEFGVLFISIGLLVFLAVVGRTALRITRAAQLVTGTVERQSSRR
jgi:predicted RND superfamily exporter protein